MADPKSLTITSTQDIPWKDDQARATQWTQSIRDELSQSPAPTPPFRIMRVNQVDAEQLDHELTSMLKYQALSIFKYFRSDLVDRIKPELEAGLNFLIYRFSVYVDTPSPGNKLQNLRYRNELLENKAWNDPSQFVMARWQRIWYGILHVGGRWFWARLFQHMIDSGWSSEPEDDWRRKCYRWCRYLENMYRFASIINFLAFLVNGRYRNLIDRLLGMRLVYLHPKLSRHVSFEFMNQQLVWHGFSEFLLFMMPLINFAKLRMWMSRAVRWVLRLTTSSDQPILPGCPVCRADPIPSPHVANCGHIFCYYCVRGSQLAESRFRCPQCDEVVHTIQRATPQHLS
eukprot:TRINITY_DN3490_c0_g1_i5.p1 TRINITY_DN3490_c0_g1~~TRINITY_DN3490_c0_g1_i5.p1  ORF type:complete len:343 (+),score=34.99 TRINITY_DN3490_c0_g1_i5:135-1163(+)